MYQRKQKYSVVVLVDEIPLFIISITWYPINRAPTNESLHRREIDFNYNKSTHLCKYLHHESSPPLLNSSPLPPTKTDNTHIHRHGTEVQVYVNEQGRPLEGQQHHYENYYNIEEMAPVRICPVVNQEEKRIGQEMKRDIFGMRRRPIKDMSWDMRAKWEKGGEREERGRARWRDGHGLTGGDGEEGVRQRDKPGYAQKVWRALTIPDEEINQEMLERCTYVDDWNKTRPLNGNIQRREEENFLARDREGARW